jgi:hypothetical protein
MKKLIVGNVYYTKHGDRVTIKKERWDCFFMAYSDNGTFYGKYDDYGRTFGGLHELHDLVVTE